MVHRDTGAEVHTNIISKYAAGAPRVAARAAVVRSLLCPIPPHHALACAADVLDAFARLYFASARVPGALPLQWWMERGEREVGILLEDSLGFIASLLGGLAALYTEGLIYRDTCPSHVYLRPAAVAAWEGGRGAVRGGRRRIGGCGGLCV